MRIVTWNTHHGGMRTDGKLDTAGLGLVLKDLAVGGVKVFCLQEVEQMDGYGRDDKVSKWLSVLGPDWVGVSVNASGVVGGLGISNAILVRGALLGIVAHLGLFDGRSAMAIEVDGLTVVSTHLSSDKQASRIVETVQLHRWMPIQGADRVVVCGDFNAGPSAVEMAPWPALGYRDAWTEANKIGAAVSFNGTGATHHTSRIDYVLGRGVKVAAADVPNVGTAAGVFPSDHNPLVVDLV